MTAATRGRELVILGSGTALPTPRRGPTALALVPADPNGAVTLIDPGPGAVQRAGARGLGIERIDRVFLTHHHPDHCLDVLALLFARRNPVLKDRVPRLTLIGGPGTLSLFERMIHLFGGWVKPAEGEVEVREIGAGTTRLAAEVELMALPMNHAPASLAYRFTFDDGVTLAISGDTDECENAVRIAEDADHYVLEAALPDDAPIAGHLTPARAAAIATRARCRHLILTHFYPPVDVDLARHVATAAFPGRVTIAEDGLRVPLVGEPRR